MDLEEIGSGSGSGPGSVCGSETGSVCEDGHRRRQSTASTDSVYGTESTTSSRESLIESSHPLNQVLIKIHSCILAEFYCFIYCPSKENLSRAFWKKKYVDKGSLD